jgi:hypothetical protein
VRPSSPCRGIGLLSAPQGDAGDVQPTALTALRSPLPAARTSLPTRPWRQRCDSIPAVRDGASLRGWPVPLAKEARRCSAPAPRLRPPGRGTARLHAEPPPGTRSTPEGVGFRVCGPVPGTILRLSWLWPRRLRCMSGPVLVQLPGRLRTLIRTRRIGLASESPTADSARIAVTPISMRAAGPFLRCPVS